MISKGWELVTRWGGGGNTPPLRHQQRAGGGAAAAADTVRRPLPLPPDRERTASPTSPPQEYTCPGCQGGFIEQREADEPMAEDPDDELPPLNDHALRAVTQASRTQLTPSSLHGGQIQRVRREGEMRKWFVSAKIQCSFMCLKTCLWSCEIKFPTILELAIQIHTGTSWKTIQFSHPSPKTANLATMPPQRHTHSHFALHSRS